MLSLEREQKMKLPAAHRRRAGATMTMVRCGVFW